MSVNFFEIRITIHPILVSISATEPVFPMTALFIVI
jgi:hypothetical protein